VDGLDIVGTKCLEAVRTLAGARLDALGHAFLAQDMAAGFDHGVFEVLVARAAICDALVIIH